MGDEIILSGSARFLTNFAFEFWGTNTADPFNLSFAGNVEARVRFYLNNGPAFNGYPTPGTNFYDSGWFSVPNPTPRSTFVFTAGADFSRDGLFLPASDMTWSVQFRGLAATDSAGVDLYSPLVTGTEYTDYWQHDTTCWTLRTFGNGPSADFAAKMEATTTPPAAPVLQIANTGTQAQLFWPLWATNYFVETSAVLDTQAAWVPLTNGIFNWGIYYALTNPTTNPAAFYRLHRPQ